jgi:UDP-glucose 4-epimerase
MPAIQGGKFVVTGGASQIGSHIGEQLLAAGAREVVLLDNLSLGSAELLQPLLQDRRCTLVRADVLRLNDLYEPLDGADGVFAVAALMASSIDATPWVGLDVNIRGLQNTFEACRYQHVKKVVFSSSTGVYGAPDEELTAEDAPLRWQMLSPAMVLYCASKVAGEALARLYQDRHGIDFVALRYSAVYGERQHRRALVGGHIADTCQRIRSGQPALVDGDGERAFDYVYAGDVARANLMAMELPVTNEAINVTSGTTTTQNRIVEIVARACGTTPRTERTQQTSSGKMPATKRYAFDREKAKRLLGWESQVSIEEGVARVLSWVDRRTA